MTEFWDIIDSHGNKTGRLHKKGDPMKDGEYHLAVSVWIRNSSGQFLISRRVANKDHTPGMWETPSGSALSGENSLQAALRETEEELGLVLDPAKGQRFKTYTYPHSTGNGAAYFEVWVFSAEADPCQLTLQADETCEAIWAERSEIKRLIAEGRFIPYDYIDSLFEAF